MATDVKLSNECTMYKYKEVNEEKKKDSYKLLSVVLNKKKKVLQFGSAYIQTAIDYDCT